MFHIFLFFWQWKASQEHVRRRKDYYRSVLGFNLYIKGCLNCDICVISHKKQMLYNKCNDHVYLPLIKSTEYSLEIMTFQNILKCVFVESFLKPFKDFMRKLSSCVNWWNSSRWSERKYPEALCAKCILYYTALENEYSREIMQSNKLTMQLHFFYKWVTCGVVMPLRIIKQY